MLRRMPIPKKIANAPELRLGLELYLTAYFDLDSCRSLGMEAGQIPWTAVEDYSDRLELTDAQRDDLHFFVKRMDEAIAGQLKKKRASQEKMKPPNGNAPTVRGKN